MLFAFLWLGDGWKSPNNHPVQKLSPKTVPRKLTCCLGQNGWQMRRSFPRTNFVSTMSFLFDAVSSMWICLMFFFGKKMRWTFNHWYLYTGRPRMRGCTTQSHSLEVKQFAPKAETQKGKACLFFASFFQWFNFGGFSTLHQADFFFQKTPGHLWPSDFRYSPLSLRIRWWTLVAAAGQRVWTADEAEVCGETTPSWWFKVILLGCLNDLKKGIFIVTSN